MNQSRPPEDDSALPQGPQHPERLPPGTAAIAIAVLALLCWVLLIFLGIGLWSALNWERR
jgi:hypothetical protein